MGLFSTKTETYVGTSAMHLVGVTANPVQDTLLTTILLSGIPYASRKDIPSNIMKNLLQGMGTKVKWAHEYAKDYYSLGLPQGETRSSDAINYSDLIPYIIADTGHTDGVIVDNYLIDEFSPKVSIYAHLLNERGYDKSSGLITNYPSGIDFNALWGQDVSAYNQRVKYLTTVLSADGLHAEIHYSLDVEFSVVKTEQITYETDNGTRTFGRRYIAQEWKESPEAFIETVAIPGAPFTDWYTDCIYVFYRKFSPLGEILLGTYVWYYVFARNLYPELNPETTETVDEFMPVIPLRFKNQDLTDPATQNTPPDPTNLYSTSQELLKKLSLDLGALGDQLNDNPSVAEMDNAYVMWGVDLQTEENISLYYLSEFFADISLSQVKTESQFLAALADPDITGIIQNFFSSNRLAQHYRQEPGTFKEYGLALDFKYDYITSQSEVGTIGTGVNEGKIGNAEKEIGSYSVTINTKSVGSEGTEQYSSHTEARYKLILRAQVAENIIRVVTIHNLVVINWVYGDKYIVTTLKDVRDNPDDHSMIFPIQYNLADKYSLSARNKLYAETTIAVINTIQHVKLKWYQQSWFRMVLIVVAIIITIWTAGGTSGWLAGLVAAAEKGVVAFALALAEMAAISMAISTAAKWLVTQLGEEFGLLATIITVVVAVVVSKGAGLAGEASKSMMTTAGHMLQGAQALISATNEFLIEEGQGILNEYEAFIEKLDGLWEELESVYDLLKNKSDIDPLTFASPARLQMVPNETPSMFYARCLNLPSNTMHIIHGEHVDFFDNRFKLDSLINSSLPAMNTYT